jgi:hypothetical protein
MRGGRLCCRREHLGACDMGVPIHGIGISSVVGSLNPAALGFRMTLLYSVAGEVADDAADHAAGHTVDHPFLSLRADRATLYARRTSCIARLLIPN